MKSFLFLTAGLFAAMSFGDDVVKVHRLTVEESLAAIEVINVCLLYTSDAADE